MVLPRTVERILAAVAPSTTREEILGALTLVCAYELHDNRDSCVHHGSGAQEENLDLLIEEGRTNLFGGQHQRLVTVRALVRRPRVLIPDELTSALGSNTEAQILSGPCKAYPKMTLVFITHRMEAAVSTGEIVRPCGEEIHSSGAPAEVISISSQLVPSRGIEKR